MTEFSTFPNGEVAELIREDNVYETSGGYDSTSKEDTTPAHLDVEHGVFVTSKGNAIPLSGASISSLMLERITNEGKPKIPMIEVTILGKHKQMQANANDPGYLALLKEWEGDVNVKTLRYIFVVGVKGQPPQEFVDMQSQFFPDAKDIEMKYLWVSSILPDEDINAFTDVVLGKTIATTKGVESAANF